MLTLDTSALIRFFTNDIPADAKKVKLLLNSEEKINIPDVVFPELEYVLLGQTYNSSRDKVFVAFQFLASKKNIYISTAVKQAIYLYQQSNLDIADCIILASATKLMSFDKKLLKLAKNIQTPTL